MTHNTTLPTPDPTHEAAHVSVLLTLTFLTGHGVGWMRGLLHKARFAILLSCSQEVLDGKP